MHHRNLYHRNVDRMNMYHRSVDNRNIDRRNIPEYRIVHKYETNWKELRCFIIGIVLFFTILCSMKVLINVAEHYSYSNVDDYLKKIGRLK